MTWPQQPLPPEALATIRKGNWPKFGVETTIAIAQGWQAGLTCGEMAAELGCRSQSLAMLLGHISGLGVTLRPAAIAPLKGGGGVSRCGGLREQEPIVRERLPPRSPQHPRYGHRNVTAVLMGDPAPGRTPWAAA